MGKNSHDEYLEDNYEQLYESFGFPYLRTHHALLGDELSSVISESDERLLLVVPGKSNELLILSNKRILIYKLPKKKSVLRVAGEIGLGFVPGVGEYLGAADDIKGLFDGTKNVIGWFSGGKRRDDAQREQDRMPSKKDVENSVWKISKVESLALIMLYRENILLENGFEWKQKFNCLLANPFDNLTEDLVEDLTEDEIEAYREMLNEMLNQPSEIIIGNNNIEFNVNNNYSSMRYAKNDANYFEIAGLFLEQHGQLLEAIGWMIEIDYRGIVLKRG